MSQLVDRPVSTTPPLRSPSTAAAVAAEVDGAQPKAEIEEPPASKPVKSKKKGNPTKKKKGFPTALPASDDPWPRPYIIEDGLRRVAPYHYTYNTFVKQRWIGRTLIEVFESEFRDRPLAYYRNAMETGQICINRTIASPEHVLDNGELVSHTIHRHEPPVTAEPVRVLHEDEDIIVIIKPSGMPVHPAGRYNFNSVVEVMKAERGVDWVAYPCNRLDRLTSGIMFIAKHSKAAEELSAQIAQRTVRKEYIARVIGNFPDGEVVCDQPLLQISPKLGLNRVRANGKTAKTVFKKLAYYPPQQSSSTTADRSPNAADGIDERVEKPWMEKEGYSIVRCLPVTGRTHQIRVHLQHLGHPIQNDPIYANQRVWGTSLGYNDPEGSENTDEDIITRLNRMGKEEVADAVAYYDEMVDKYYKQKAEKMSGQTCSVCNTPLYTDPGTHELELWLHSLRYEDAGGSWSYVSPLPGWALPPDGVSGPTKVGGMEELVEAVKDENPEIAGAE